MTKTALQITPEDMAIYRATARRRAKQERQALAQRTQKARILAEQAAKLLKEQFGARQVILFGSLARGNFFHRRSDVDLAVTGLKNQDFWRAWSALDTLGTEFETDLVTMETVSAKLRLEIEREGIEL